VPGELHGPERHPHRRLSGIDHRNAEGRMLGLALIIAVPLAIILGLIAERALPKTSEGDIRRLR